MSKCIVFDRDGTLIKYVPYLKDPKQVELLPFVKEVINWMLHHKSMLKASWPFWHRTSPLAWGWCCTSILWEGSL
mgnify:CR=1 FL=1